MGDTTMTQKTISRGGKIYVLVEQGEYRRLTDARSGLPPLPAPDRAGNVDAVAFARATIARNVIARRQAAGMSQAALAEAAGVRIETLNRLENARHTADVTTLMKIDRALDAGERRADPSRRAGAVGGRRGASNGVQPGVRKHRASRTVSRAAGSTGKKAFKK